VPYVHAYTQTEFFFTFFIQTANELVCISDTFNHNCWMFHLGLLSEASLVSGRI